ncbi:hypothetical protein ARAM_000751 [Aspergillus rambellii]|uniref:Xylanolytic transcriptional activator regulatory domain-containing protein n=2 Tax=Aspergillus subgen. Nidulantes TaxID=2720870 RepID=A0A0F8WJU9_9EURO|nr:hypothetical protein ARAM_000751 [Aspergillus rambellii]
MDLASIAEVKAYLQHDQDPSPEEDLEEEPSGKQVSGPVLLLGNQISSTGADLLAALPVRSVADRLVSFYLNCKESTLVIMHIPTFAKEYAEFWKKPEEASINWLAYLYSILCSSTGLHLFSASGRADGDLAEAFDEYHRLASQCLARSDYTTPGRYKMEALLLNIASEILRSSDTHIGPSVLLGLATRLAMHSGYHRDPRHYGEISVFDGEMRRRVWMCLSLLDHYISLQAGLPPSTPQAQSDCEEPRNLNDNDLDPSATALPPSRPPGEKTPILFPATLNRVMFACADIIRRVSAVESIPYREVLRLDQNLHELSGTIPPPLRFSPLAESIADAPSTIMDRYNIDLMYQKARCDLHRRYLTQCRLDPAYAYSRRQCLDGARTVLQHQSDIFDASSPGGQLGYTSFFFAPCVIMHFRVAAMIVSLEISCQSRYDLKQKQPMPSRARQEILAEREQLSRELERSFNIWKHLSQKSNEALKTAQALHVMLKIARTHLQHGATPDSSPLEKNMHGPSQPLGDNATTTQTHPTFPPDITLLDATFYLGQDANIPASSIQFAGSASQHITDIYDRYWDNLMLLGGDVSLSDMGSQMPGPGEDERLCFYS